jgi:hypothetical protein
MKNTPRTLGVKESVANIQNASFVKPKTLIVEM